MFVKYLRLCFLFCLFIIPIQANVKEALKSIPPNDREDLEGLFYQLVNEDQFGYTLFGDKPVSIGSYFNVTPWENFIELGECNGIFWKKWATWEKYKNQFKIQNYLLLKETSPLVDEIFIINKKSFIKMLNRHLDVFERILNKSINPKQFLRQIEEGKISFSDSIQNNEILLGICLGYGRQNAILYHLRSKILTNECLDYFGDYNRSLIRINPSQFMADHQLKETKTLQQKYKALRAKISVIYSHGNFLDITLTQLTAD